MEHQEREVREHERQSDETRLPDDPGAERDPADGAERQVRDGPASDVRTVSRVRLRKWFGSTERGLPYATGGGRNRAPRPTAPGSAPGATTAERLEPRPSG